MRVVTNFFKWSFYAIAFVGILSIGGVFGVWLTIETLVLLMDVVA
jgi:hypothetical protein